MKKTLSFLLCVILSVILCVPASSAALGTLNTGIQLRVRALGVYTNWDGVTNVAQFKGDNGGLYLAVDGNDYVKIYKTKNGSLLPGYVTLTKMHPTFGTALCDSSGNFYLVTGEKNNGDNTDTETIFISKYDKNGNHIATTGDNGSSSLASYYNSSFYTKIPFDAGNCDAAISGDILTVNYGREMYSGHQSNSVFSVNINNMSKVSTGACYNSHSFAQRVVPIDGGFVHMSEGDYYDRAFTVYSVKMSGNSVSSRKTANIFDFWVKPNSSSNMSIMNNNQAHMGGMAALSDGRIAFASTSVQSLNSNAENETEEIFIQIFNPFGNLNDASGYTTTGVRSGVAGYTGQTSVTNYGVKWLTSYGSGNSVKNPQIASTSDDKIVVLYEYFADSTYKGVYYILLDNNGNIITPASQVSADARLNPCEMPVYADGMVCWAGNKYGDSTNTVYVFSFDLLGSSKADISGCTISSVADQTYTGSAIRPTVTVTDGSKTLTSGTDYTVAYSNNTNVGTATVTVTGKGSYTGTKTATFKIVARNASNFTISSIADQTYTGSAIRPTVTVTDGSKTLTKDTDYTVSYSGNTDVGTATVTVIGKGNYTGTKTATFRIVSVKPAAPVVTATPGDKQITLTWAAVPNAAGYGIHRYNANGTYTRINLNVKTTSYTIGGLTNGTKYTYLVQAFTADNKWSDSGAAHHVSATPVSSKPAAPVVTATPGDGKIMLTWAAVPNAAGYGIHRYNANGTYTRINLNVKTTSYTIGGLTNGTKYTYLVQAFTADNKWSDSGAAHHVSATPVSSKPAAPVVTATPGDKQITLTWAAVPNAAGYAIHRYNANGTYTRVNLNVKTTSYTISGLTNGTKYTYIVQAFTSDNKWSDVKAEYHASATPVAGGKPAAPVVTATPGDGKITLSWAAVPNAVGYGIHRYNANGTYTRVNLNVTSTSYTIGGLTNGTKYTYIVQAFTADNKWSEVKAEYHASATPVAGGKPAAPVVTATPGDGEITLAWAAVPNAVGYGIHRYNANGTYTRVNLNVKTTSYTISGLTNGTKYTYIVQAFTADNKWSDVSIAYHVSATPEA